MAMAMAIVQGHVSIALFCLLLDTTIRVEGAMAWTSLGLYMQGVLS